MRDMAHSICLIKLYQITIRKKFRFFVSDYLKVLKVNVYGLMDCLDNSKRFVVQIKEKLESIISIQNNIPLVL